MKVNGSFGVAVLRLSLLYLRVVASNRHSVSILFYIFYITVIALHIIGLIYFITVKNYIFFIIYLIKILFQNNLYNKQGLRENFWEIENKNVLGNEIFVTAEVMFYLTCV